MKNDSIVIHSNLQQLLEKVETCEMSPKLQASHASGTAIPVSNIITAKPEEIPPEDIGGVALVAYIPETSAPPTTTPLGTLGILGAIVLVSFFGKRLK